MSPTPWDIDLSDDDGVGRFTGQATGDPSGVGGVEITGTPNVGDVPTATSATAATWQPSGGSQPDGILTSADFLFQESAGAGTYMASLPVPAGTVVLDVFVYPLGAPWDADTALLNIVDTLNGAGAYCDALPLAGVDAGGDVYDPAAVNSTVNCYRLSFMDTTNPNPDYVDVGFGKDGIGVNYEADDTIVMTIVTTGAGGTTGKTRIKIIYFTPITAVAAVKS